MKNKDLIDEWILFADNDLISAKHLYDDLHPKQIYISSYLSHQCAEKSLKAVLIHYDCEPPKIHNLSNLCEMCIEFDETFNEISDLCSRLDPYGVVVKYPNQLEIDENLAKIIISRAQSIYDFCKAKIN
ncbi:MAG: HEPN domain-containing protein [Chitinivibrionia bacterium]|nr:HEPN domain-containing protein [Chitinivibrionia bacterium]